MLSHSSPLSKNTNFTEPDKSPVGTKTNQLTAKIDNSLSNAQNIEEILKRNQHASTSVSVTSKNITTANYLNQNNQYITSQPIPSHNAFVTLTNAGSPQKTTLEELEKKLLELEKVTQDPKSVFSQNPLNPLLSSPEALGLSEQNKQRIVTSPQFSSPAFSQNQRTDNSEKKKTILTQEEAYESREHQKFNTDNERGDVFGSTFDRPYSSAQKGRTALQSSNQQGGLGHAGQRDPTSGEDFAHEGQNEIKNSSKRPTSAQKLQKQSLKAGSAHDRIEYEEDFDFDAQNQNIKSQLLKLQQQNIAHEDKELEGASQNIHQGSSSHHSGRNNIGHGPGYERSQASFGHDSSHHEPQIRTIDLQAIMPSQGSEKSQAKYENGQFGDSGPLDHNVDQSSQNQARLGTNAPTMSRLKQDVSEFLVTKQPTTGDRQETEENKSQFTKSFENNLSVDQNRKSELSTGKNRESLDNEFQQKYAASSAIENSKSHSTKENSKNLKSSVGEDNNEYGHDFNQGPLRSRNDAQYNPADSKATNKNMNQRSHGNSPKTKAVNKRNMDKGSASPDKTDNFSKVHGGQYNASDSEGAGQSSSHRESYGSTPNTKGVNKRRTEKGTTGSQAKETPDKAGKFSKTTKKAESNSPSANAGERAFSAGKPTKGLTYERTNLYQQKKNASGGYAEEDQAYEDLFETAHTNDKQKRVQNRPSESSAQRVDSIGDSQNEKRLSRMDEDQAANLYEQRKAELQSNMKKMSKGRLSNAKKQEKKPVKPAVTNPLETNKMQRQKLQGGETNAYGSEREIDNELNPPQPSEISGSKRKALPKGNAEIDRVQETNTRDSKASWQRGATGAVKTSKQGQAKEEVQGDNGNKFGDAIQHARDNIFQRMENIERALNKDDVSSARSDKRSSHPSYSSEKAKARPSDIDPQSRNSNKTPIHSSDKLRTPITAKTEISTATSPQDQYSHLTSNKPQGYSALKSQTKSSQKEKQSSKASADILSEPVRPISYGTAQGSKQSQNYPKEEKPKNSIAPSATPTGASYNANEAGNRGSNLKKISFPSSSGDQNRADLKTPSKRGENSKPYMSENKQRVNITELGNAQRDLSGSKQMLRSSEGPKVVYSEVPAHSKYHEKRQKAQAEKEESLISKLEPARNLEATNAYSYSKEIPAHSKYHEKRMKAQIEKEDLQAAQGGPKVQKQVANKNKTSLQEESDQKPQRRTNQNLQNQRNEAARTRKEVSFSPRAQEQNLRPISDDLSFEERTRLWLIKKNQNLAEKERMKYSQESMDCTFRPALYRNENLRKLGSNEFYQRNIEWSEKIKAENALKAEIKLEEQQKPEPQRPRIKSNPTSPVNPIKSFGIFAKKDLETVKKSLDVSGQLANKKLATYLEYGWNDDRLKKEIDDIEELYSYVKSLVKSRLDPNASSPSKSFSAEKSTFQSNIQKQNASPYTYKHKNPFGRASLSAEKEIPRMQSLRNFVGVQNSHPSIASERASITKKSDLDGSLHQRPSFHALMDNEKPTRLVIQDNRYVIVNDDAPEGDGGNN